MNKITTRTYICPDCLDKNICDVGINISVNSNSSLADIRFNYANLHNAVRFNGASKIFTVYCENCGAIMSDVPIDMKDIYIKLVELGFGDVYIREANLASLYSSKTSAFVRFDCAIETADSIIKMLNDIALPNECVSIGMARSISDYTTICISFNTRNNNLEDILTPQKINENMKNYMTRVLPKLEP